MSCTWTSAAEAPGVSCPWTLPDLRRQPEHPGGASSQQHEQGHRRAHILFPFDRIMSFSAPGPRPADAWTLLRLEVKMQDHDQAHGIQNPPAIAAARSVPSRTLLVCTLLVIPSHASSLKYVSHI